MGLAAFSLCFVSCSSNNDEPEPPAVEDSFSHDMKEFAKRYNLPQDKILELQFLTGIAKEPTTLFYGLSESRNLAVFVCDTVANRTLYSNFAQLTFPVQKEFTLAYGEKASLPFLTFRPTGVAYTTPNSFAMAAYTQYSSSAYAKFARTQYRFFYNNGTLKVIECPQALGPQNSIEKVIPWYDGSYLFFYTGHSDNFDSAVACTKPDGSIIYECARPYFDFDYVDMLDFNRFIQPYSNTEAISVYASTGYVEAYASNIPESKELWQIKKVAPADFTFADNDRVELSNHSFSGSTLKFTVEVTSYNGTKLSYDVALSTDGKVEYSNIK